MNSQKKIMYLQGLHAKCNEKNGHVLFLEKYYHYPLFFSSSLSLEKKNP